MHQAKKLLIALITAALLLVPIALEVDAKGDTLTRGCPCVRLP